MNVLFMNDTTGLGGGEIWASRMVRALQARGHRCGIAAPVSARLHSIVQYPDMRFRYSRLDELSFVPKLRRFVEKESIDVILCTVLGSRLETWVLNEMCLTSKRTPAIVLKLGLPPYPRSAATDYGYGLHPAFKKLLVVCKHNRKIFLRKFPELARNFVHIAYTGIDLHYTRALKLDGLAVRRELGISRSTPLVVNASRVTFHKGQALLVQAAVRFLSDYPAAHLLIVGHGAPHEIRRLRAVASGCGLGDRIHFWGFRDDIRPVLAAATVFVHPSLLDGIPNALLEAMARGCPCVATSACGIPELLEHDRDGVLVPPGDIDALAAGVSKLLGDATLRASLGRRASRRADSFDLATRARELESELMWALEEPSLISWRPTAKGSSSPRRRTLRDIRTVVISQSEGMGDQVQALPFFLVARNVFARQHVTLVVPRSRRRLFEHLGFDEVLGFDGSTDWTDLLGERSFDIGFDLHLRPGISALAAADVRQMVSFPKDVRRNAHTCYTLYYHVPLWRQFVGLLRSVGVHNPTVAWQHLRFAVSDAERRLARRLLEGTDAFVRIAVSPGGFSMQQKRWGIPRFAAALDALAKDRPLLPVLLGHYREADLSWELQERLECRVLNLSNRYPGIGVLLALLENMDLHLTNDNGVMHLADVMDVPQVVLFGPTDYRFFGPMGRSSRLVVSSTRKMKDIPVSTVVESCRDLLKLRRGKSWQIHDRNARSES